MFFLIIFCSGRKILGQHCADCGPCRKDWNWGIREKHGLSLLFMDRKWSGPGGPKGRDLMSSCKPNDRMWWISINKEGRVQMDSASFAPNSNGRMPLVRALINGELFSRWNPKANFIYKSIIPKSNNLWGYKLMTNT